VAHPAQDDAKALAQLILNDVCLDATLLDGRSHKDRKNLRVLSLSGGFILFKQRQRAEATYMPVKSVQ